jgi:isopropylmalate/homocitrate/citramalate synthase
MGRSLRPGENLEVNPVPNSENRSQIWVSELNARPEIRSAFPRSAPVRLYDTTLRDGEQAVGIVLDPLQKLEIARHLSELGISRIEAGFPRVSVDDGEAIRLILEAKLRAEVWGFSRALKADLDELIRLGVHATIIEAPASDIKLRAYKISRDEVLRRIAEAVAYAKQHGIAVAFFAVDGTRTELSFLKKIYETAIEAGAEEIVVVDTIGVCGPEAVEYLVRQVRGWLGETIPLHFHGHNDFGLATASAIAAVRGGAQWIQGTINGMGERAGNADLGEIAMALHCLYDVPVEMHLEKIRAVSELVRRVAGYEVEAWKPVVGKNLFVRESGAVASQFNVPEAIEPFAAELVGARRAIALGKKSGLDSIALKCQELGIELPEELRARVLAAVKKKGIEKRGLVTNDEFAQIVASVQAAVRAG